jgi:lipopolysaccharide/colanic/teichoic acid biosynthesis glycosyltransferase
VKRGFDIIAGGLGLAVLSPVILIAMLLVYGHDGHSPLYIPLRAGRRGCLFHMYKIRTMTPNADVGPETTCKIDSRVTPVGAILRRFKLDEIPQLVNVIMGDMSLVGPRPNTVRTAESFDAEERRLLDVAPGITDLASIAFSDMGALVQDAKDPDLAYNTTIRPWKSRLGLFYIENVSLWMDIPIILLTLVAIVSRPSAIKGVQALLRQRGAPDDLIAACTKTI